MVYLVKKQIQVIYWEENKLKPYRMKETDKSF